MWQKKNAIKNADVIICISENTKSDLLRFYPEVAKKEIHVIYNGVSDDYYQIAQIEKDFTYLNFLFVGSRVFYKNFKFCIDWLNTLDSSVLHIVGGALSKWEQKYLDVKLPGRYVYHGMINNHKLNELYNKSTCLLYPSLYEGFGIPVLEAMRAGCPVIALNCSSLPEVCGSAGVLVDNLSFNDFNTALNTVLTNREELIRRGVLQASSFSWDRCYNQVKIIYKRLGNCL